MIAILDCRKNRSRGGFGSRGKSISEPLASSLWRSGPVFAPPTPTPHAVPLASHSPCGGRSDRMTKAEPCWFESRALLTYARLGAEYYE